MFWEEIVRLEYSGFEQVNMICPVLEFASTESFFEIFCHCVNRLHAGLSVIQPLDFL